LDLDDDHPGGAVTVEKEDDGIGAVFGGLDLGQVGRGDTGLGVVRKRNAEHLDQDLGGEGWAVLEEIHEDLVGHGGHAGDILPWKKCRKQAP
jgi:hypothetical protein